MVWMRKSGSVHHSEIKRLKEGDMTVIVILIDSKKGEKSCENL